MIAWVWLTCEKLNVVSDQGENDCMSLVDLCEDLRGTDKGLKGPSNWSLSTHTPSPASLPGKDMVNQFLEFGGGAHALNEVQTSLQVLAPVRVA